jgi:hypothetical protein
MIIGLLTKGILSEKGGSVTVNNIIELPLGIELNLSESNIDIKVDKEPQITLAIDKEFDLHLEVEPE